MIRDRTRLSRLFGTCIGKLQARIAGRGAGRRAESGVKRRR
jgi:hypothetical protein